MSAVRRCVRFSQLQIEKREKNYLHFPRETTRSFFFLIFQKGCYMPGYAFGSMVASPYNQISTHLATEPAKHAGAKGSSGRGSREYVVEK